MSANIILNSIRIALLGANGSFAADCRSFEDVASATAAGCADPNLMVISALQWVIGVSGAVAIIFVVYGGISYATSAGEPSKTQKAKHMITYALIGLAIVAIAEIITAFVSSTIRNANNNITYSETTFAKEIHEDKTH